jgi:C4-dicarboxylate transporter DctM subunit
METSLFNDPAFWLLIAFVIPLVTRVPIAISLGLSALLVGWWWDMGVDMLSYNFFAGVAKVPLLAIPFFILAGFIMERAGIASRIVLLVETLVGDMTGGLAIATVGVATFWGAVSGSGPATVAALGLILIPAMVKSGYDKPFAAATVSVTSGLAIVIPPSIAFIVYGGIADVSVPALFAAGFVPGIIVAGFLGVSVFLTSRKKGYRGKPRTMPIRKALREAFWGVMKLKMRKIRPRK